VNFYEALNVTAQVDLLGTFKVHSYLTSV